MENIFQKYLPFDSFSTPGVSETFCERIVVDFKLGYFLILISRHCDKLTFFEDISSEGGVGKLENVTGSHKVKSWLVLVHRVQDCLKNKEEI